ncbi:hypothetical protein [Variovorax boronicumulans]|uniref:hypothetical protein n=1 Tax=Variovorax boronicumulans TaxID=436515 RepID=UPI0033917BEF
MNTDFTFPLAPCKPQYGERLLRRAHACISADGSHAVPSARRLHAGRRINATRGEA